MGVPLLHNGIIRAGTWEIIKLKFGLSNSCGGRSVVGVARRKLVESGGSDPHVGCGWRGRDERKLGDSGLRGGGLAEGTLIRKVMMRFECGGLRLAPWVEDVLDELR